jgi:hypothetical protein
VPRDAGRRQVTGSCGHLNSGSVKLAEGVGPGWRSDGGASASASARRWTPRSARTARAASATTSTCAPPRPSSSRARSPASRRHERRRQRQPPR